MNHEVIENLNYFSELTQRTLSAFHLAATEDTLDEDMTYISILINNSIKKKIVNFEFNNDGTFTRIFSDGTRDNVTLSNINNQSTITFNDDYIKIRNILDKQITPITSIKLDKNIKITDDFKSIEKPSEKIFFLNNFLDT
uniref:Putative RNA-polymerase subunit n=1 Tax=Millerozyma acaciae TaxID=28986 RepID=Q2P9S9_9ASCO|nr:putative RNA-polymerase subunit [Millerozyma acaciae]